MYALFFFLFMYLMYDFNNKQINVNACCCLLKFGSVESYDLGKLEYSVAINI